jgi:hypothetical protein
VDANQLRWSFDLNGPGIFPHKATASSCEPLAQESVNGEAAVAGWQFGVRDVFD